MNSYSSNDGKTAGIISYFTLIGWLIAYFAVYPNNKTALASYQLRQTLLFHLVSIVVYYIVGLIVSSILLSSGGLFSGLALIWIVRAGLLIIWLVGLLGAINGDRKPMPLIGERAQSIFSNI